MTFLGSCLGRRVSRHGLSWTSRFDFNVTEADQAFAPGGPSPTHPPNPAATPMTWRHRTGHRSVGRGARHGTPTCSAAALISSDPRRRVRPRPRRCTARGCARLVVQAGSGWPGHSRGPDGSTPRVRKAVVVSLAQVLFVVR